MMQGKETAQMPMTKEHKQAAKCISDKNMPMMQDHKNTSQMAHK